MHCCFLECSEYTCLACIYLCFRYNPYPPDLPPSHFGHHLSSPGPTNRNDGLRFPNKPPAIDNDIEQMLSRLRQSSSKQPLLRQPLLRPGSPGGPSVFQLRHQVPGLARQQGPSAPQEQKVFRPQLSAEHDQDLQCFAGQASIRSSDRYRQFESEERLPFSVSGSESGKERDENDQHWQMSGTLRNVGAPRPMRFRSDMPRPPPMPQLHGMRPPSLLALDIQRSPSMHHQQLTQSQKDLSKSPILSEDDEEIEDQRPPAPMTRGNHRPPMQLQQDIERPLLKPGGQRPISMQDCPRPHLAKEHLRPPVLPEGFRPPRLPTARPPLLPQSLRLPHFDEDSESSEQQSIPQRSLLPRQNLQRPPSFFKDHVSKPSSAQKDQFPSQGRMLPFPSSHTDNEVQNYRRLPTPTDLQRHTSREMQQNVDAVSDLSRSRSASWEEMHRPPQSLKAGPPSLMDMNIQRPPVRPPIRPALLPPSSHKPLPNVHGISDPNATPLLGQNSQQPFTAQQGSMLSLPPPPATDAHRVPGSYQAGMSDEPLKFTGRMLSHSVGNSFQHKPPPHVPNSGMRPPVPSSTAPQSSVSNQIPGAGSYPLGMSDEPLQFTGRMPAPRIRYPSSYPQQQPVPGSSMRPTTATQSVEDSRQTGASSYPLGMSDEPLQFTGRMPTPRIQHPFYQQHQQHVPNSSMRPLLAPQFTVDGKQTEGASSYPVDQSDEPLQFTGRMPTPRIQHPSYQQHQQLVPSSSIRPLPAPQSAGDGKQTQGASSYPVGQSDEPLQFTGRMPAPRIQHPSYQQHQQLVPSSSMRPLLAPQSAGDGKQTQGASSYPVGQSDEPLQFTSRMPAPRIQHLSSYQQPQHLPNSDVRSFSSSPSLNSTAVSTPGQTLLPSVRLPPGMQPPFIGMPPRQFPPPPMGNGPSMDISARLPQPFPGGNVLRPPADGSIALPGSKMMRPLSGSVANIMLPPPAALRQPFFSSMPNLVSC